MRLKNLLRGLKYEIICGNVDIEVSGLAYNTKKATLGNVFVCIRGYEFDAHSAIEEVASRGVSVVVVEKTCKVDKSVVMIRVDDTKKALAKMSANLFDRPYEKLITIGITGTSGKTTTAYMIKGILEGLGVKTGLIGTIEVYDGKKTHTFCKYNTCVL